MENQPADEIGLSEIASTAKDHAVKAGDLVNRANEGDEKELAALVQGALEGLSNQARATESGLTRLGDWVRSTAGPDAVNLAISPWWSHKDRGKEIWERLTAHLGWYLFLAVLGVSASAAAGLVSGVTGFFAFSSRAKELRGAEERARWASRDLGWPLGTNKAEEEKNKPKKSLLGQARQDIEALKKKLKRLEELVQSSSPNKKNSVPAGTIAAWPRESPPPGWLPCDGRSLPTADYEALAIALGASGPTFSLPNYQGQFLRGATADRKPGHVQPDMIKAHSHPVSTDGNHHHILTTDNHGAGGGGNMVHSKLAQAPRRSRDRTTNAGSHSHIVGDNPGGGEETRPRNIAVQWMICTGVGGGSQPRPSSNNSMVPFGSVVAWTLDTEKAPPGWLVCDGKEYDLSKYPIGERIREQTSDWPYGSTASTFTVPDYRGLFLRGLDDRGTGGLDPSVRYKPPFRPYPSWRNSAPPPSKGVGSWQESWLPGNWNQVRYDGTPDPGNGDKGVRIFVHLNGWISPVGGEDHDQGTWATVMQRVRQDRRNAFDLHPRNVAVHWIIYVGVPN